MPLPRTFGSDLKRTPLYTLSEEDELENDKDDVQSILETKKTTVRPKSAADIERRRSSESIRTTLSAETKRSRAMSRSGSSENFNAMEPGERAAAPSPQRESLALSSLLDQLKDLHNDVQQVLEKQKKFSAEQTDENISTALLDSQTSVMSKLSTCQSEISNLCQGVELLKNWAESSHNHSSTLSKSIESLVSSVAKHNEDLVDLTATFKIALKAQKMSSTEQKESLNNLKRVSNESKALLEELWTSYEKDSLLLRKEKEALLAEKEKIAQDRIQLEKAEALFEQRKLAARDELEHADEMMRTMKEAEAKVSGEMERLVELSQFVVGKNSEAEEKLAEAQRLSMQLREWQGAIAKDHDDILRLKLEVEDDRLRLSRDRVSLLKNKPSNLALNPLGRNTRVNLMHDFCLTKPVDFQRHLSSVRAEVKRLSR